MSKIFLVRRLLLIPLLLASLSGCGPTYPAKTAPESIKKICKEEYGLDVKVNIIGKTIGVSLPVENLVDASMHLASGATKKVENVSLSVHRVLLSTDRDIEFYVITAWDAQTTGAEFRLTSFFRDVKRVRLQDISRGDYHQRIVRDFRFNPSLIGEEAVRNVFARLSQGEEIEILDNQSPQKTNSEMLHTLFFPTLTMAEKGSARFLITEIESKEISKSGALIYCKTKESYTPKPGVETLTSAFPPEFENAYLVLVDMAGFPNVIKEILPRYFLSNGGIKRRFLAQSFAEYKDEKLTDSQGMLLREVELPHFLAEQITNRIRFKFQNDKGLSETFHLASVNGEFREGSFRFVLDVKLATGRIEKKGRAPKLETPQGEALKVIAEVIRGYSFEDFHEAVILNPAGEILSSADKQKIKQIK